MYEYLIHFAQRFSTFLMNFQFEERLLSCQTNQPTNPNIAQLDPNLNPNANPNLNSNVTQRKVKATNHLV